jgi:hypothetical protein
MQIETLLLAAFAAPGFWELIKLLISFIHEIITGRKKISNAEIAEKLDKQGKQISALEKSFEKKSEDDEEKETKACRRRILRADDEIRMGMRHSQDFFEDVLRDVDFYENYCDEHTHFKNRCAESAIRNVTATYEKCKKENDFL